MKGSEMLGDIISMMMLIGVSFIAGGVILWTLNITQSTGWGAMYSLTLDPVHQPIKYETMILSYIEITENSAPIKSLVLKAIEQGTVDEISYKGSEFDLESVTTEIFDKWMQGEPYLLVLKMSGVENHLAGSSKSFVGIENKRFSVKKINIPIRSVSKEGELIMYVYG